MGGSVVRKNTSMRDRIAVRRDKQLPASASPRKSSVDAAPSNARASHSLASISVLYRWPDRTQQFPNQTEESSFGATSVRNSSGERSQQPVQELARDILAAIERGLLVAIPYIQQQLEQIATNGFFWDGANNQRVTPPRELLTAILDSAWSQLDDQGNVQPGQRMTIISFIRPRDKDSQHKRGRAVDISGYAGKRLHVLYPQEAIDGAVALIQSLSPGYYALGLPRPPQRTLHDQRKYPYFFEAYSHDPPILKAEYRGRDGEYNRQNVFLAGYLKPNSSPGGALRQNLKYFVDPDARNRFAAAVEAAAEHDAIIRYVFPDAPDHIHLCVGSTPNEINHC